MARLFRMKFRTEVLERQAAPERGTHLSERIAMWCTLREGASKNRKQAVMELRRWKYSRS